MVSGGMALCRSPATTYPSVPAAAIGKPSAAEVATALWIRTLHQVMNGTDRNAPPAPTMLETTPIVAPTPNSPALPGSWRIGLGGRIISIPTAETPVKTPNTAASSPEDIPAPTGCPTTDPRTMPG